MAKVWKVVVRGRYFYEHETSSYNFYGVASECSVAGRQAKRAAKRQEMVNIEIISVECLGEKDFG